MAKSTPAVLALMVLSALVAHAGPIRLDNGATLVLDPVPGAGGVSVIALYETGFAHDLAGVAQTAHLAEHLRVTAGVGPDAPNEAMDRLNRIGGANAETLGSVTYYDYALPAGVPEIALRAEAARLTELRITPADIEREVSRVVAEVRSVASSPMLPVGKFAAMAAAQFWRHDRGLASVGVELADPPTPEVMDAYINERHRPARLTLVVTGDFDANATEQLARETIGAVPDRHADRADGPEPDFTDLPQHRRVVWAQPATVVLVALPGGLPAARAELEAVAGRVAFALQQRGAAGSVVSSGSVIPSGPLPLFVGVCVPPDTDIDPVLAEVDRALDRAARTPAGTARAAAAFLAKRLDTPDGPAVRANALRGVAARGLAEDRAHVDAARLLGNTALQNLLKAAHDPRADGPDDGALEESIRAVFGKENRRVLILTPE